jgi:aerobic-type carbon monoxide dehydrogenase small subunit (CoxS/CutS family)
MLENNHTIHLTLNGESRAFTVEPQETLLHVLRERAHLTGAKKGCDLGECGACTAIMDGRAVNSCCVFAIEADGSTVETIEGIGTADEPHPLQQAFIDAGAIQCGYCTPGCSTATPIPRARRSTPPCLATSAAARATQRSRRPSSRPPGSLNSTRTERRHSSDGTASFRHYQPRHAAP